MEPRVLEELLQKIADDRRRGRAPTLESYLERYPRHRDAVAVAFHALNEAATIAGDAVGSDADSSVTPAIDTPLDRPPPAPGETIGSYRLIRELGRGGQGVVYLAEDTRLSRRVALKVLAGQVATSEAMRLRFRREAEATSRLDHPGLCTVYEVGEERGRQFIAMRHVEGQSLAALLMALRHGEADDTWVPVGPDRADRADQPAATSTGRESTMRFVRLVEKAARATHAAHEASLVHRDIKPANIMVTAGDEPVILDFGLARLGTEEGVTLTRTGEMLGTPSYMAPEQIETTGAPVDRRTDVYALGVTLYECVTLLQPFRAPTREGLYREILRGEPARPSSLNPHVPRDLEIILATAMERDVTRRYRTAEALAEDLRRLAELEPIRARPAGPGIRLRRWMQRNPALAASVSTLMVLLAVGLVVTTILWRRAEGALDEAQEQRARADGKSAEARANLDDFLRLSDVRRLDDYVDEATRLWPAHAHMVPAFEAWLARARDLASRLPDHERRLVELRGRARKLEFDGEDGGFSESAVLARMLRSRLRSIEELLEADTEPDDRAEALENRLEQLESELAGLDEIVEEGRRYGFEDIRDAWVHDVLSRLVVGLRRFADPDPAIGVIADVAGRVERARRIRTLSELDAADAWRTAMRAVEDDAAYAGLELTPRMGFVPIGADPDSGLQEFALVESGVVPERGADGRLRPREEHALVFVLIPPTKFFMGAEPVARPGRGAGNVDPDATKREGPVQSVELDAFLCSKYEVTQAQWTRITGENPSGWPDGFEWPDGVVNGLHPVENVSWEEAVAFLARVDLLLPTEAQWECAARAGTRTVYWTGDDRETLRGAANIVDKSTLPLGGSWPAIHEWPEFEDRWPYHAPIGTFRANRWGLHDVHGNVFEWCRDAYAPLEWPALPGDGARTLFPMTQHVVRGGSYKMSAGEARIAKRAFADPGSRSSHLGVRPVASLTSR